MLFVSFRQTAKMNPETFLLHTWRLLVLFQPKADPSSYHSQLQYFSRLTTSLERKMTSRNIAFWCLKAGQTTFLSDVWRKADWQNWTIPPERCIWFLYWNIPSRLTFPEIKKNGLSLPQEHLLYWQATSALKC